MLASATWSSEIASFAFRCASRSERVDEVNLRVGLGQGLVRPFNLIEEAKGAEPTEPSVSFSAPAQLGRDFSAGRREKEVHLWAKASE